VGRPPVARLLRQPVSTIAVDEVLEFTVQEVRSELVALHFLEGPKGLFIRDVVLDVPRLRTIDSQQANRLRLAILGPTNHHGVTIIDVERARVDCHA